MADIGASSPSIRDFGSLQQLPVPTLDENTPQGQQVHQVVNLANAVLRAFQSAFPAEPENQSVALTDTQLTGIDALLAGEIDSNTLQALASILLGELAKSQDSGEARAITQGAERTQESSDLRDTDYEANNAKIQEAYDKLEEAKKLEIAGYAALAAGAAIIGVPFVGWIAGPILIAAGAALLISAAVIKDQAGGILDEAAAATQDLQDAEAAENAATETAKYDALQKVFGELAATTITTNVNALLNVLGLASFPNDIALALEPGLTQGYIEEGFSPEEAAEKGKADAAAAANALSTTLVSVILLTALANTQDAAADSGAIVQGALTSGLESASEALQSVLGADTPVDINTLGEAIVDAAGDAIEDYFDSQLETLVANAPDEEAAEALRGAVTSQTQESVALLKTVVPGLFTAQQNIQSQVAGLTADLGLDDIPESEKQDPKSLTEVLSGSQRFVGELTDLLNDLGSVTGDSIVAQQQGTSAREHVPSIA